MNQNPSAFLESLHKSQTPKLQWPATLSGLHPLTRYETISTVILSQRIADVLLVGDSDKTASRLVCWLRTR